MSLYDYSMGTDLPPILRNALLGSEEAAAGFNSMSSEKQRAVISGACAAASVSDIEEIMKQSDTALCSDICASEYRDIGTKPL